MQYVDELSLFSLVMYIFLYIKTTGSKWTWLIPIYKDYKLCKSLKKMWPFWLSLVSYALLGLSLYAGGISLINATTDTQMYTALYSMVSTLIPAAIIMLIVNYATNYYQGKFFGLSGMLLVGFVLFPQFFGLLVLKDE